MTPRDIAAAVTEWARHEDNVRVAILTSSRADPTWAVDELSDYDIELFVRDLEPFLEGDAWLHTFGEILVKDPYKPELTEVTITSRPDGSRQVEGNAGSMVIFTDGERIDFGIMLVSALEDDLQTHGGYFNDMGYRVLLDKDGWTSGAIAPTYRQFDTKPPTEEEFLQVVHGFWWDITYVAKCLYRDQVFLGQRMLNTLRHGPFLSLVSWHLGMLNGWRNNPGALGKNLKEQLAPQLWSELEVTFAGPDAQDNARAMFKMAEIFGRLASDVADHVGHKYPNEIDRGVTAYLTRIQAMTSRTKP